MFGYDIPIDIPPIEAAATFTAICFPVSRWTTCKYKGLKSPHILMLFLDLLRGAAFFPFILLLAGAFSKPVLHFIEDYDRTTLVLAGLIGAVSVFKSDRWMIDYIRANLDTLSNDQPSNAAAKATDAAQ